jgi:hypothetical protein
MLRAPETGALYEGYAQKGFGVPSIDGSPIPLGSTATHEPIEIPGLCGGGGSPPMSQGCNNIPVDQEAKQPKTKENQHSMTIEGQAVGGYLLYELWYEVI